MPVCLDCENRVAFVHRIRGTEPRLDKWNGAFNGAEYQQFDTIECWCAECESHNVDFDVDPDGADALIETPGE